MSARAEQLEAWPELKRNERLQRALTAGDARAAELIQRSWPNAPASNRAQLQYIVVAAIATFFHDWQLDE